MPACNEYRVDAAGLQAFGDRLMVAVGVESGGGPAARGGRAVAAALGRPVVDLPGDHGSFFDSSYGEPTGTDAVAARLRSFSGTRPPGSCRWLSRRVSLASMPVVVVTDSTASLPPEVADKRGLVVVPLQVVIGADVYDEGSDGATPELVAAALKEFRPVSTSRRPRRTA